MLKTLLQLVGAAFAAGAAFVLWTPWRVHGGRFVSEYAVLAGVIAALSLAAFLFAAKIGD